MIEAVSESSWQVTFPVIDAAGRLCGVVPSQALHVVASEDGMADWIVAGDVMQEAIVARMDDHAVDALSRMMAAGLRQIPVLGAAGEVAAYLDERAVAGKLVLEPPAASVVDPMATPIAGARGEAE